MKSENWVEYVTGALLILGLSIAFILKGAATLFVIFLCGLMSGRLIFKSQSRFPLIIIVTGFVLGYIMGSSFNSLLILVLFVAGFATYHLMEKVDF